MLSWHRADGWTKYLVSRHCLPFQLATGSTAPPAIDSVYLFMLAVCSHLVPPLRHHRYETGIDLAQQQSQTTSPRLSYLLDVGSTADKYSDHLIGGAKRWPHVLLEQCVHVWITNVGTCPSPAAHPNSQSQSQCIEEKYPPPPSCTGSQSLLAHRTTTNVTSTSGVGWSAGRRHSGCMHSSERLGSSSSWSASPEREYHRGEV